MNADSRVPLPSFLERQQEETSKAAEKAADYLEEIEHNVISIYMGHRCSHPEDDPICALAANLLGVVWMIRGYMLTQSGSQPLSEVLEAAEEATEE